MRRWTSAGSARVLPSTNGVEQILISGLTALL
jgi:hypothetical protein